MSKSTKGITSVLLWFEKVCCHDRIIVRRWTVWVFPLKDLWKTSFLHKYLKAPTVWSRGWENLVDDRGSNPPRSSPLHNRPRMPPVSFASFIDPWIFPLLWSHFCVRLGIWGLTENERSKPHQSLSPSFLRGPKFTEELRFLRHHWCENPHKSSHNTIWMTTHFHRNCSCVLLPVPLWEIRNCLSAATS